MSRDSVRSENIPSIVGSNVPENNEIESTREEISRSSSPTQIQETPVSTIAEPTEVIPFVDRAIAHATAYEMLLRWLAFFLSAASFSFIEIFLSSRNEQKGTALLKGIGTCSALLGSIVPAVILYKIGRPVLMSRTSVAVHAVETGSALLLFTATNSSVISLANQDFPKARIEGCIAITALTGFLIAKGVRTYENILSRVPFSDLLQLLKPSQAKTAITAGANCGASACSVAFSALSIRNKQYGTGAGQILFSIYSLAISISMLNYVMKNNTASENTPEIPKRLHIYNFIQGLFITAASALFVDSFISYLNNKSKEQYLSELAAGGACVVACLGLFAFKKSFENHEEVSESPQHAVV